MEIKRFTFNDAENIAKAFNIRQIVFVEEQNVSREEEFDEYDKNSIQYLAVKNNRAFGTARWRITENGVKLERFAVLKESRGKGIGGFLLKEMLKELPFGYEIYLHAQKDAIIFYEKNGFEKSGSMFSECAIDHFKMKLNKKNNTRKLSLMDAIDYVRHFHQTFKLYAGNKPNVNIEKSLIELRYNLMHEENEEYLEAAKEGDLVEVADALGDMLYILCGTIITHGMQDKIEEVYAEIQRSNMSKLDENGNPIFREDGKVLKSQLYFKPNIRDILNR